MIIKVNLTLKDVFSPVANSVAIYFRLTVITLKSSHQSIDMTTVIRSWLPDAAVALAVAGVPVYHHELAAV